MNTSIIVTCPPVITDYFRLYGGGWIIKRGYADNDIVIRDTSSMWDIETFYDGLKRLYNDYKLTDIRMLKAIKQYNYYLYINYHAFDMDLMDMELLENMVDVVVTELLYLTTGALEALSEFMIDCLEVE